MTDATAPTVPRMVDARGSFCPGPLMELIRAIRESEPGRAHLDLQLGLGQQDRYPEVGREGGPSARRGRQRDGYDEIIIEKTH